MALPNAYLTSFKNAEAILRAIQSAQAPPRFTQKFLEGLGFPNTNDRAIINILKALGFLDDTGVPTRRYHEYLDQTQSDVVLAQAIREAYADLFRVNNSANDLSTGDVKNKFRTLSEGQFTDRVLTQMAGTFTTLAKLGDFGGQPKPLESAYEKAIPSDRESDSRPTGSAAELQSALQGGHPGARIGGLVYNINLHLPESRDPAVYDALFRSLRAHLL